MTLTAGDVALAFLSVNGLATQETNPTSTWVFQSRGSTDLGDDVSWFLYQAATTPTNGTLTINAGNRWSVVAFVLGGAAAPPIQDAVVTQRQLGQADTGSVTLTQTPISGNLLVAVSSHRSTGSSAVISGTGWTQRVLHTADLANATLQRGLVIWTKAAGAGEPTAITATWTPTSTNRLVVQELQADRAVTWTFNASAVNSV